MTLHRAAVLRHQRVRPRATRHMRVVEEIQPAGPGASRRMLALLLVGVVVLTAAGVIAVVAAAKQGGW